MSSSAPLSIALMGAGIFAREQHLPAILSSNKFALKAVYSRSLKSAKELLKDAKGVESVDVYSEDSGEGKNLAALLNRDDIAAVDIVMPIFAQPALVRKAWAAGKHVIQEKPVAQDVNDARELMRDYAALKEPRPLWAVAEQFRYFDQWDACEKASRELGETKLFSCELLAHAAPGGKYFETAWRKDSTFPGYVVDGGVHNAAGLRRVLSSAPVRVAAFTNQVREYLPPVDTLHSAVQLANGATGTFTLSFGSNAQRNVLQLSAERGSLEFTDMNRIVVKDTEGKVISDERYEGQFQHAVSRELNAFADNVKEGKIAVLGSPEEAYRDLALIDAILDSGKANGAPQSLE